MKKRLYFAPEQRFLKKTCHLSVLTIVLSLFFITNINSQTDKNFYVSVFVAKQKVDEMDFYYRLFNLRKIDRAIFVKNNIGYGAIPDDYKTYNLPKFGVSVKYWLKV